MGKRVMAHAMASPAGIRNALIAGVTSIEHGCLLDEEGIALMKEKGAYLVPTLVAPGDVISGAKAGRRRAPCRDDRQGRADPARSIEPPSQPQSPRASRSPWARMIRGRAAHGPHSPGARGDGSLRDDADAGDRRVHAGARRVASPLGPRHARAPGKLADVVAVRGDPLANIDSHLADPRTTSGWSSRTDASRTTSAKPRQWLSPRRRRRRGRLRKEGSARGGLLAEQATVAQRREIRGTSSGRPAWSRRDQRGRARSGARDMPHDATPMTGVPAEELGNPVAAPWVHRQTAPDGGRARGDEALPGDVEGIDGCHPDGEHEGPR